MDVLKAQVASYSSSCRQCTVLCAVARLSILESMLQEVGYDEGHGSGVGIDIVWIAGTLFIGGVFKFFRVGS